ncbi:MAG TPA: tetratricopeptide repeat protein, partial [Gallionella sp.]|nr:tetratricopeptide repeat protein [Gallionella sp.]
EAGQYELALTDYRHVIELMPDSPAAYTNMGSIYLRAQQWQKAVESFDKAIEIMKSAGKEFDSGKPYFVRAIASEQLGNHQQAREDYRVSCRIEFLGCDKL